MNELATWLTQDWQTALIGAVGTFIVLASVSFLIQFFIPALRLKYVLRRAYRNLKTVKDRSGGTVLDLKIIKSEAMADPRLAHLWSEYTETLHPQRREDNTGVAKIYRWRATTLAETFFTEQAIVDTPLKTEFYKHLPGILTGLGIIGTFAGLISGLQHFNVSDPSQAQNQLAALMNAVGHAFMVSATAISLAMLFTWIEKSLVTGRYRQVEELCQIIDSLFEAGAGEEYLERLVRASETQATQAMQIKDALVVDLKQVMGELLAAQTQQQIAAQDRHAAQISAEVGQAIAQSLGGPIADIATAVKSTSANQGEAVNRMLTDVLANFSDRMQGLFGGQMQGMSDLLRQTSEAMQQTAAQFAQLASGMDAAGQTAVDKMSERLTAAIAEMEGRQQIMNQQMREFVEQLRGVVADSQNETGRKLQESLTSVGDQVSAAVAELRRQAEDAAESQGRRQLAFQQSTDQAIGNLSEQTAALLQQSTETNHALQTTVAKLTEATDAAMTQLNAGAETLYIAASDFAKAGQGVAATMTAASSAVEAIRESTATLSTASSATRDILADYSRTRDAVSAMVAELNKIVENARREAGMTTEAVETLRGAAETLATAQRQADEYLQGISQVLEETHRVFAENVERTLREGNRHFQGELRNAVDALSGTIQDLDGIFDKLPTPA